MAAERRLAALVERAEAAAWADMFRLVDSDVTESAGLEVRHYGAATALMSSRVDTLAANRILGLGLDTPLDRGVLDTIVADYRERAVPRFALQWCPPARPSDIESHLSSAGFRLLSPSLKLCRSAEAAFALDREWPQVVEIGPEHATRFEQIVCGDLGVPGSLVRTVSSPIGHASWKYYLAYDGERPIAGAAVCARDEVAWCGLAATLPEARRRGIQSTLLARRIRDAASAGCKWISADTLPETAEHPNQSLHNMRRLGFEILYERKNFVLEGPSDKA